MSLQVITKGKVIYSANRRHVYLDTGKQVESLEYVLDDYEGKTVVVCLVEEEPKVLTADEVIDKRLVAALELA